jgi:hypothetical protein
MSKKCHQNITIQISFVHFINDDVGDAIKSTVALKLPQKNTKGAKQKPCILSVGGISSNDVSNTSSAGFVLIVEAAQQQS